MDFQNRAGSRFGTGAGQSDAQSENAMRRERLRKLALETIDLSKDPYFMKNHSGGFECRLCLTLHTNEGSYLAHTQGKKHSTNLARRAQKEQKDLETGGGVAPIPTATGSVAAVNAQVAAQKQIHMMYSHLPIRKVMVKIGRPGYKVTKIRDPQTMQPGLLFQIYYPQIADNETPHFRFMSSYEQRIEPPSKFYQYLLVAAEPYDTVAFKVQSKEVDRGKGGDGEDRLWSWWDADTKLYHLQFFFKDIK